MREKNNNTDRSISSHTNSLQESVSSRRDFLRSGFCSLLAPSLIASPILRHGGTILFPEAGDLMDTQAHREGTQENGSLSQKSTQQASTKLLDKTLSFYNIHTGESLKNVVYWAGKAYVGENLRAINKIFRDHRTGDITTIDPKLLDLLYKVQEKLETNAPFHLISGYRSPKTNAMLQANSCGVAKQSQHCLGKAADIALPKTRSLKDIHKAAKSLRLGGVGIYSQFVHVDTGRVRYW